MLKWTKEYRNKWANAWYHKNKKRIQRKTREWAYRKNYGLWFRDVESMLKRQKHRCAICRVQFKNIHLKRKARVDFRVDHCHETGATRSLLCQRCNTFVGYIETNGHLIEPILDYLRAA